MDRLTQLKPVFVEFIPDRLEHGELYISRKYEVSIHLCACGCGRQTVVPFGSGEYSWQLTESDAGITLSPSIGNFQFPCRSHYFITDNKVQWV